MSRSSKAAFILSGTGCLAAFVVSSVSVHAADVPLKYRCEDGSRVSIAEGTGEMTVITTAKAKIKLPFAGYMSSHGGFGKHTECYVEDAPCAEIMLRGPPSVYITLDAAHESVKCASVE